MKRYERGIHVPTKDRLDPAACSDVINDSYGEHGKTTLAKLKASLSKGASPPKRRRSSDLTEPTDLRCRRLHHRGGFILTVSTLGFRRIQAHGQWNGDLRGKPVGFEGLCRDSRFEDQNRENIGVVFERHPTD